ncbi:unnamed protein product [Darwinula stevensoni]|uniref:Mannosyltransferase n=1 Tax=Darwinula stevensoni TaxID=69355 RepID=A0A7R8X5Y5_9CRUS|nr:unnamed protein product [Darwinula stevensoni]CAG0880907.1 unnamed protein product [Darwinula stevensoni]
MEKQRSRQQSLSESEVRLKDEEVGIHVTPKRVALFFLSFRVINALVTRTYFVPDETWQSLEIAHHRVFGYGFQTWEWHHEIRSWLYPGVFVALYKLLAVLGLDDNQFFMVKLPQLIQGLFGAVGEICIYHVALKLHGRSSALWTAILQASSCGLGMGLGLLVDSWFYGHVVLTPWQFLKVNILEGVSDFYGTSPWHAYLTSLGPVVFCTHLLPLLILPFACWFWSYSLSRSQRTFLLAIFSGIAVLSYVRHKEMRFLLPFLPLLNLINGDLVAKVFAPFPHWITQRPAHRLLFGILLFVNVVLAMVGNCLYMRGPIGAMELIAEAAHESPHSTSVLFLLPCHSTPYYSHVHVNISMHFLTCEPNWNQTPGYLDEADQFYLSVILNTERLIIELSPSYIVTASHSTMELKDIFHKCQSFLPIEGAQPTMNSYHYGRIPANVENMYSLKVDNLTYRTTPEDLKRAFERYGDVGDVYIPRDRFTKESRGFAFVRFYDRRDAEDAMDSMDGKIMDGRELRVQMAKYGRPSPPPYFRSSRRSRRLVVSCSNGKLLAVTSQAVIYIYLYQLEQTGVRVRVTSGVLGSKSGCSCSQPLLLLLLLLFQFQFQFLASLVSLVETAKSLLSYSRSLFHFLFLSRF